MSDRGFAIRNQSGILPLSVVLSVASHTVRSVSNDLKKLILDYNRKA
jgi:hypothetical protein